MYVLPTYTQEFMKSMEIIQLWEPPTGYPISSGKSPKMVSAGVPVVMSLTLGVEQLVGCAGVESEVVSSSKRFLLRFTTRP
jgi:hypothetical protein